MSFNRFSETRSYTNRDLPSSFGTNLATRLDAADGKLDGKFFGADIVTTSRPTTYTYANEGKYDRVIQSQGYASEYRNVVDAIDVIPAQRIVERVVEAPITRTIVEPREVVREVQYETVVDPVVRRMTVEAGQPTEIHERIVEVPVEQPIELHQTEIVELPQHEMTQKRVPEVHQRVVEIPNDRIVERVVDKVVIKTVEVPVERIVEKFVQVPVDRVVERIVERIVEVPRERIIDVIVEKIVEVPVEVPLEKIVERIVEVPVEVPFERLVEKIVQVPVEVPVEKVVEKIVKVTVEVPVVQIVEKVVEVPVERVVEKIVEVPVEKLVTFPEDKVVPQNIERVVKVEVPVDRLVEVQPVEIQRVEQPVVVERVVEPVTVVEKPIFVDEGWAAPRRITLEEQRIRAKPYPVYRTTDTSASVTGTRTYTTATALPTREYYRTDAVTASRLDAADGRIDGKFHGTDIISTGTSATRGATTTTYIRDGSDTISGSRALGTTSYYRTDPTTASRLDAADGRIDGKFHGTDIITTNTPASYSQSHIRGGGTTLGTSYYRTDPVTATRLDAADGRIDGKFHGTDIITSGVRNI